MAYRWESGGAFSRSELEGARLVHEFDTQQAAEEWLTAHYTELLLLGVAEVTLMEEDRVVYGPMPLTP